MPAAVPLITTAISAGVSIYQTSQANKRAKEAQKAIDNYQRQDLTNPYENVQISTEGADRQREDLSRAISTFANQAAMGGSRSILGLAPSMLSNYVNQEAQIMANLDEQEKQRQQLIARGNEMVQNMREAREIADLSGLGTALNTANHERINGINNLVNTGISAANYLGNYYANKGDNKQQQQQQQQLYKYPQNNPNRVIGYMPDLNLPTSVFSKTGGYIARPSFLSPSIPFSPNI